MFTSIIVTYKGFSISAKFRLKLVAGKALVKAVFSRMASFG
jgi:hypothetical protein